MFLMMNSLTKYFLNKTTICILHTINEKLVVNSRTGKRYYRYKETEERE